MAEIGFVPLAASNLKYKEGTIVFPANDTTVRSIDVGFTIKLLIVGNSSLYKIESDYTQIVWNPEQTTASNTAKVSAIGSTYGFWNFYVAGRKIYYFPNEYSPEGSVKWSAYGI